MQHQMMQQGMMHPMMKGRRPGTYFNEWRNKQRSRINSALGDLRGYLNFFGKDAPFNFDLQEINKELTKAEERAMAIIEPLFNEGMKYIQYKSKQMHDLKGRLAKNYVYIVDEIPSKDELEDFKAPIEYKVSLFENYLKKLCKEAITKLDTLISERKKWRKQEMEVVSRQKGTLVAGAKEYINFPGYEYEYVKLNNLTKTTEFSSFYSVAINEDNLRGLFDQGWLSSSILNNYSRFLMDWFGFNQVKGKGYILNESEVMHMKNPQSFKESIPNYDAISGIFIENDKVGAIINKNNNHWLFLGILPKDNVIILYDSIFQRDAYDQYISPIIGFMNW